MTRHLTEAEARFLATRDRILARRNPELLARENAEFEAMSDEELAVVAAGLAPPESNVVEFQRGKSGPLAEADPCSGGWGVTEAALFDAVRAVLEIVAGDRLRSEELDCMTEAAWVVFIDKMREAGGG
jgi:hypothetical protein